LVALVEESGWWRYLRKVVGGPSSGKWLVALVEDSGW
jgi:hypothetical protein